jgi:nicotinamide-nucleotide amidase
LTEFDEQIAALAFDILAASRKKGWRIATAESCTGGLVAAALTDVAGSSDVFDRGLVTYSNAAKSALLGVSEALLMSHGAVSSEVAAAMAQGALDASGAELTISITGIAGPGGGSAQKPVGLVHFATGVRGGAILCHKAEFGDPGRGRVRHLALLTALTLLQVRLD